jgi:hypothetical protein
MAMTYKLIQCSNTTHYMNTGTEQLKQQREVGDSRRPSMMTTRRELLVGDLEYFLPDGDHDVDVI